MKEAPALAAKDAITPEDIRNLPLIISERSLRDNSLADWLGKDLDDVNIVRPTT